MLPLSIRDPLFSIAGQVEEALEALKKSAPALKTKTVDYSGLRNIPEVNVEKAYKVICTIESKCGYIIGDSETAFGSTQVSFGSFVNRLASDPNVKNITGLSSDELRALGDIWNEFKKKIQNMNLWSSANVDDNEIKSFIKSNPNSVVRRREGTTVRYNPSGAPGIVRVKNGKYFGYVLNLSSLKDIGLDTDSAINELKKITSEYVTDGVVKNGIVKLFIAQKSPESYAKFKSTFSKKNVDSNQNVRNLVDKVSQQDLMGRINSVVSALKRSTYDVTAPGAYNIYQLIAISNAAGVGAVEQFLLNKKQFASGQIHYLQRANPMISKIVGISSDFPPNGGMGGFKDSVAEINFLLSKRAEEVFIKEAGARELREKYPEDADLINSIMNKIPPKYLEWAVTTLVSGDISKQDEIANLVNDFDKLVQRGKAKNIPEVMVDTSQWIVKNISLDDVKNWVNLMSKQETRSEKKKVTEEDIDKLYSGDRFEITYPKTKAAAIKEGRGTNWCISADDTSDAEVQNYFNTYRKKGADHIFILDKKRLDDDLLKKIAITIIGDVVVSIHDKVDNPIYESDSLEKSNDWNNVIKKVYGADSQKIFSAISNYASKENELSLEKLTIEPVGSGSNSLAVYKMLSRSGKFINGAWEIDGDVFLNKMGLSALPIFSRISGSFYCSENSQLTSLIGCPSSVGGDFNCTLNTSLVSLLGCPASIGGNFKCSYNPLKSLINGPTSVGKDFICNGNQLKSLVGSPASVNGEFNCSNNQLESLSGSPSFVGGDFNCSGNYELISLKYLPQNIAGSVIFNKNNVSDWELYVTGRGKRINDEAVISMSIRHNIEKFSISKRAEYKALYFPGNYAEDIKSGKRKMTIRTEDSPINADDNVKLMTYSGSLICFAKIISKETMNIDRIRKAFGKYMADSLNNKFGSDKRYTVIRFDIMDEKADDNDSFGVRHGQNETFPPESGVIDLPPALTMVPTNPGAYSYANMLSKRQIEKISSDVREDWTFIWDSKSGRLYTHANIKDGKKIGNCDHFCLAQAHSMKGVGDDDFRGYVVFYNDPDKPADIMTYDYKFDEIDSEAQRAIIKRLFDGEKLNFINTKMNLPPYYEKYIERPREEITASDLNILETIWKFAEELDKDIKR